MSTIGEAIRRARKAKGLTLQQLGALVDKDTGNLSRLETGKQGATQTELDKICNALGISISGAISANTMRLNSHNSGIPDNSVPVILYAQIANWIQRMEDFKKTDAEAWIACPVEHGARTFAVTVTGDSMLAPGSIPSFSNGDYVFCDPDRAPKHGSPVIARTGSDHMPIFRRLLIEGDKKYLQALNPSWPDRIAELLPEGEIIGTVIFRGEIV